MKGLIKIQKDNGTIIYLVQSRISYFIHESEKIDICIEDKFITLYSKNEIDQFLFAIKLV